MATSPISGPEPIVRKAIATLQQNLPDVLVAEWAKWDDDIPLDQIASWDHAGNDLLLYPSVEVAVPDLDLRNFALAQLAADGGFRVHVRCSVIGETPARIYFRLCRYFCGILGVLMQPGAFGPGLVIDKDRGAMARLRGGDLEVEGGSQLYGAVIVTFWLAGYEARA